MTTITVIDPPGGWLYGFPKQVHDEFFLLGSDFDLHKWLVSEGYPQEEIDKLGDKFYYRTWTVEIDDEQVG